MPSCRAGPAREGRRVSRVLVRTILSVRLQIGPRLLDVGCDGKLGGGGGEGRGGHGASRRPSREGKFSLGAKATSSHLALGGLAKDACRAPSAFPGGQDARS